MTTLTQSNTIVGTALTSAGTPPGMPPIVTAVLDAGCHLKAFEDENRANAGIETSGAEGQ